MFRVKTRASKPKRNTDCVSHETVVNTASILFCQKEKKPKQMCSKMSVNCTANSDRALQILIVQNLWYHYITNF